MKNLQIISKKLPKKAILNKHTLRTTKGGRRWVTAVKAFADYYYNALKAGGHNCKMSYHDGKYCIEW